MANGRGSGVYLGPGVGKGWKEVREHKGTLKPGSFLHASRHKKEINFSRRIS